MQILLLNLTGNKGGFENQNVQDMKAKLEVHGNNVVTIAAHGQKEISLAAQRLSEQFFDFTIIVAHGAATEPISYIELGSEKNEQVLNDPYLLPSVFPSIWKNHKLLIVCEGLNKDMMAALATGLPENPVSSDSLLIAKTTSVYPDEAIRLVDGIFARIDSSIIPTKALLSEALKEVKESDDWWAIEGSNIIEED